MRKLVPLIVLFLALIFSLPVLALDTLPKSNLSNAGQSGIYSDTVPSEPSVQPGTIPLEAIANATYHLAYDPDLAIKLTAGEYQDQANHIVATLAKTLSYGDLDGDGSLDTIALVDVSGGGTGLFRNLVAILNKEGAAEPVASAFLGDRVQINKMAIDKGHIVIDALTQGPQDGACCPTMPTKFVYTLNGAELTAEPQIAAVAGALANLSYPSTRVASGKYDLVNGAYEEGETHVSTTGFVAQGDLDGNGQEDAAVVLSSNPNGSADFYDLYAIISETISETAVMSALAPLEIGDRIQMRDLSIDNGEIIVTATIKGANDADCCPTQMVAQHYALQDGALTLTNQENLEQVLYGRAGIVAGGAFDANAEPSEAQLNLGGTNRHWLDPSLVSVLSGSAHGPSVDAKTLGEGCSGYVPQYPDVVLNWSEDSNVDLLRLFVLGAGNPLLLVVTPAGDVLCNDDFSPLVSDPYLEIANPQEGRYAVFVGSNEGSAVTPGFFVVTSQNLNPATLDVNQLFPRQTNTALVRTPISATAMLVDAAAQVTPATSITSTALPYSTTLTAGGPLAAFKIELGNALCTGFVSGAPNFAFDWSGQADQVTISFEATANTTLIVRDPDGNYQCNDNAQASANLNPALTLMPADGHYLVWVGSHAPDVTVDGVLTINEGATTPTVLTPDSAQE